MTTDKASKRRSIFSLGHRSSTGRTSSSDGSDVLTPRSTRNSVTSNSSKAEDVKFSPLLMFMAASTLAAPGLTQEHHNAHIQAVTGEGDTRSINNSQPQQAPQLPRIAQTPPLSIRRSSPEPQSEIVPDHALQSIPDSRSTRGSSIPVNNTFAHVPETSTLGTPSVQQQMHEKMYHRHQSLPTQSWPRSTSPQSYPDQPKVVPHSVSHYSSTPSNVTQPPQANATVPHDRETTFEDPNLMGPPVQQAIVQSPPPQQLEPQISNSDKEESHTTWHLSAQAAPGWENF